MDPKTLAFYLPQFHRIPENDQWWGEGFTEWTAVKGAEKLFEGHNQPRVPLNKKYYNLMEYETMAWQAELMKKYCVDGMCMYHYWFEDGRRILEKPAENLLKWKDIDMPFCFCWANETWSRTWRKLDESNVWSSLYESKKNIKDNGILLRQTYGREKEWEEHFQYLLPFFEDERYIKLDHMPVFIILTPSNVFPLWSMVRYFQMRAKENELPGLYIIGMEENISRGLNAAGIKQPRHALNQYLKDCTEFNQLLRTYSYDKIWELILGKRIKNNKTYLCGMVDYDDTPRMGSQNGHIMIGASPEKFYKYFKRLYMKSLWLNNEFIFLNAWNEWGEGMYLEPDERNNFGYLEAIRKTVMECKKEDLINEKDVVKDFYESMEKPKLSISEEEFNNLCRHDTVLDQWLYLRDRNINFTQFFEKYGYHNIAIYGMGKLGMHLYYELSKSDIKVSFGIDRNSEVENSIINVYSPEQQMPEVDAVVLTVINEYDEICEILSKKMECPMITLEEIIQECILKG